MVRFVGTVSPNQYLADTLEKLDTADH
jgi:hypothetical protein